MRCPNCHKENPDTARFCEECGTNLTEARMQRDQNAKLAADTGFAFGQAARQARMEAFVQPDELISDRAYNAVLLGVLVWGFLVNVALCAFVGDVYRYIKPGTFLILYLVLAFGGIMIAARSNNAAVSFLGYNMVVVPFGLVISTLVWEYGGLDSQVVRDAFVYTLIISLAMLGLEMMFPTFFAKLGRAMLGCLLALLICELVLLVLRVRQSATDWIAAGIFSVYIAYDIYRSQQFPKTLNNAVDSALDIYLDIANLFIRLLRIFGKKKD